MYWLDDNLQNSTQFYIFNPQERPKSTKLHRLKKKMTHGLKNANFKLSHCMSLSNLSLKNNRKSELFGIFGIVLTFWPRQRVQNSLKSHGVKVGAKKNTAKVSGVVCPIRKWNGYKVGVAYTSRSLSMRLNNH